MGATRFLPQDGHLRPEHSLATDREHAGAHSGTRVCRTPVGGVDLVPTFFGVAEIEVPWTMHEHDLLSLLRDPRTSCSHPVLLTNTARRYGSDTDVVPTTEDAFRNEIPWYVISMSIL